MMSSHYELVNGICGKYLVCFVFPNEASDYVKMSKPALVGLLCVVIVDQDMCW